MFCCHRWNSLPAHLRQTDINFEQFKRQLDIFVRALRARRIVAIVKLRLLDNLTYSLDRGQTHGIVPKIRPHGRPKTASITLCRFPRNLGHTRLRSYYNANVCLFFAFINFLHNLRGKYLCHASFGREKIDVFALMYAAIIWELHASVDMDISMDIHGKSVNMDMDMGGKFHIRGKPEN